jgi:hypothetical protein
VEPYVDTREVRFKVKDAKAYDEKALFEAFLMKGFPDATMQARPAELKK